MRELFLHRKQEFLARSLKYARYVFNDHFVLFLMVFLGFLSLQYSQFLKSLPSTKWPIYLVLVLISVFIVQMGTISTYLENADQHFLLMKEEEIVKYVKGQTRTSYLLWAVLQSILLVLLFPLFLALGLGGWIFLLYLLGMAGVKYFLFQRKAGKLIKGSSLDWEAAIALESARQQSILRFFALFTNVKGISNSVKRRAYLDVLLRVFPKDQKHTWQNLYLRSYLRNGDLFSLTLRLFGLSVLSLVFINQSWVASIVVLLFNYLLIFQLIGLYQAYDYQYLTKLFPLDSSLRQEGLKKVIQLVTWLILGVQTLLCVFLLADKLALLTMVLGSFLFATTYLSFKVKRLVD